MPRSSTLALALAAGMTLQVSSGLAVAQGTEEQQQACTPDALKLCSDTIPDIAKTTACMKAHYAQLTPRCQTAFHDATGGAKTTAHKTPATPRARVATRAEHQSEARGPAEHHADRRLPEREGGTRDAVSRDAESTAVEPRTADGYPPFPSPDASPIRPVTTRSQIADACRAGLIDSFTCSTTVPALLGTPSE